MAELDALRTEVLGLSAKKIQSKVRSFLARKKYIQLQQCAIQIQAVCRGIIFFENWNENFNSPVLCFLWDYWVWLLYCVSKEQLQGGVMKTFVGRQLHWKFRPATVCIVQGNTMCISILRQLISSPVYVVWVLASNSAWSGKQKLQWLFRYLNDVVFVP